MVFDMHYINIKPCRTQVWYGLNFHSIDLLQKSHNAPVPYPTMHYFVARMCTCVHFRFLFQYGDVFDWCGICEMSLYILHATRSNTTCLSISRTNTKIIFDQALLTKRTYAWNIAKSKYWDNTIIRRLEDYTYTTCTYLWRKPLPHWIWEGCFPERGYIRTSLQVWDYIQ